MASLLHCEGLAPRGRSREAIGAYERALERAPLSDAKVGCRPESGDPL
jgi:hypothetical protein